MLQNLIFPAHIRATKVSDKDHGTADGKEIQSVQDHCKHVAARAGKSLSLIGMQSTGFLAGILHDAGKFTSAFSKYIEDAAAGRPVRRGSVNHTFAGVYIIQKQIHVSSKEERDFQTQAKDLIAYAIGAHHGQFDCLDENGNDGIEYRIHKDGVPYEEAWSNYQKYCLTASELNRYLESSCREVINALTDCAQLTNHQSNPKNKQKVLCFYNGCLARLLQSAVIDADRKDTAEFMQNCHFPELPDEMADTWNKQLIYAEQKMASFDQSTPVNRARSEISRQCRQQADLPTGIFRLNVPTGAGKTLASLRFALAHAARWNKRRIIFTSPLLSILEQNADVIRSFIEDQSMIIEHHSNAVNPEPENDELNINELYTQTWDAPIIITTLVQLLNVMFDGKTGSIRRFHSLCDAVIIIDEVQSVPANLLTVFNLMVSFLSGICHTTIILCSATLPYTEAADYPIECKITDLVPYQRKLWSAFKRSEILNGGKCTLEDIPGKVPVWLGNAKSMLIICNKKSESEKLYANLSDAYRCFHLSASMCASHRRAVLDDLRAALAGSQTGHDDSKPVICISTQVMEAGVDISFERVVRLLAGMDNIVQAAGRCNRNGEEKDPGAVYMVDCSDESLVHLNEIKRQKEATEELLYEFEHDPGTFHGELDSEEAIRRYYMNLYQNMDAYYQNDVIKEKGYCLFDLLSDDVCFRLRTDRNQAVTHTMTQAFKEAGRAFTVFDEKTVDVIVPYDEGADLIADLNSLRAKVDPEFTRFTLRRARNYTVSLYDYQRQRLMAEGALYKSQNGLDVWFLKAEYYSPDMGISLNSNSQEYLEV